MRILAIDPGPERSGVVLFDTDIGSVEYAYKDMGNEEVLFRCGIEGNIGIVLIEQIAGMGQVVGKDVFETVFWSGRFAQAAGMPIVVRIPRSEVKLRLCGTSRAKDPNVRMAICDRFGGEKAALGKKKNPGPLYGVSSHAWAAMGLVCAWLDVQEEKRRAMA